MKYKAATLKAEYLAFSLPRCQLFPIPRLLTQWKQSSTPFLLLVHPKQFKQDEHHKSNDVVYANLRQNIFFFYPPVRKVFMPSTLC